MPNYKVTGEQLSAVADAIREKGGTSESLAFPGGFVNAIKNISGSSGAEVPDSTKSVIFIDYDGTVVASKTKAEITAMTSDSDLPANPTHTGLTAQGWNWTVTQLKAQLTATPDQKIYVGQMYVTASGATEIDVVMPEGRLDPILTISPKGTISVDWGDGTTPDEVTGTSYTSRKGVSHTYAHAGNYTIKISKTSGDGYAFYGSQNYTLLRKNSNSDQNIVYANTVQNIRLGNDSRIGNSAFYYCYSLASITIPNSVTSIGNSAFNGCYSLPSITIPSNVTSIGNNAFQYCYSLASITIPNSVTSIGGSAFNNCHSLTSITIPSSVTSIGVYVFQYCRSLASITIPNDVTSIGTCAFSGCYSLASITIPSSVTSIEANAFQYCYGMGEYHFQSETVPTGGTTMFASIPSDCIIYVPYSADHSILESYKTATNWSTYASYMQEEPQS